MSDGRVHVGDAVDANWRRARRAADVYGHAIEVGDDGVPTRVHPLPLPEARLLEMVTTPEGRKDLRTRIEAGMSASMPRAVLLKMLDLLDEASVGRRGR